MSVFKANLDSFSVGVSCSILITYCVESYLSAEMIINLATSKALVHVNVDVTHDTDNLRDTTL